MSFEREIIKEINELRTNPKGYTKKIKKYISYFDGKLLNLPGSEASIETQEGPDAYTEAINFLSKQKGIESLEPSKGLHRAAKDFVALVKNKGPEDLESIDLDKVVEKYGKYSGNLSRALDFGGETPEQVLVNLIVSDGDPKREQRENLLNKELKKVGAAIGKHDEFGYVATIIAVSKFTNERDKDDKGFI